VRGGAHNNPWSPKLYVLKSGRAFSIVFKVVVEDELRISHAGLRKRGR